MAPSEHLAWFADNVDWFGALDPELLDVEVAACPGWTVRDVVHHLTGGLGVGYPWALGLEPSTPDELAFVGVEFPPPDTDPLGRFRETMADCFAVFASVDPDRPAYTYAGPGTAGFWFRRAAIETTLHRMDVADALAVDEGSLPVDRALDAVAETVEFALPLAATWTGVAPPPIEIHPDGGMVHRLGGPSPEVVLSAEVMLSAEVVLPAAAVVSGPPTEVLRVLWGRSSDAVTRAGDPAAAEAWLSLVERAFAGR